MKDEGQMEMTTGRMGKMTESQEGMGRGGTEMKDEGQMEMTTGRMGKMRGHKKEWEEEGQR